MQELKLITLTKCHKQIAIKNYMETELLTINQVGELLQVSRAKVYELMADKEHPLPVFYLSDRTPRFRREDIKFWIETKQQESPNNNVEEAEGGEK